jgi:hypothetical protein
MNHVLAGALCTVEDAMHERKPLAACSKLAESSHVAKGSPSDPDAAADRAVLEAQERGTKASKAKRHRGQQSLGDAAQKVVLHSEKIGSTGAGEAEITAGSLDAPHKKRGKAMPRMARGR